MTLTQTLICLVQQMTADGVTISSIAPLAADGPAKVLFRYRAVLGYLRQRGAAKAPPVDIDTELTRVLDQSGGIAWHRLGDRPWLLWEGDLLPHIGSMVWIGDRVFVFGRLEGVMPGIALVTPRPEPTLPPDPVAAWRARTEGALPFSLALIAPASAIERAEVREHQRGRNAC